MGSISAAQHLLCNTASKKRCSGGEPRIEPRTSGTDSGVVSDCANPAVPCTYSPKYKVSVRPSDFSIFLVKFVTLMDFPYYDSTKDKIL